MIGKAQLEGKQELIENFVCTGENRADDKNMRIAMLNCGARGG